MREMSKKNPYYLSVHRRQELKHYCMQYYDWKGELNDISFFKTPSQVPIKGSDILSPVEEVSEKRIQLQVRINSIEKAAKLADETLANYILLAVTKSIPYHNLTLVHGMVCSEVRYKKTLQKFFYILSELRK